MDKNKILKIFIIVILILFFIIGCFTIYKFIIINKIFNKMEEYVAIENYYMKIIDLEDESESIEVYYKDGIGKMMTSTGIYTWTDGTEAYLVDDENKQIQSVEMDSSLLISNEYVGSMVPGYSKNRLEKFLLAGNMNTSIKIEKYDSIKYYIVTTIEDDIKRVSWFKYTDLLPYQVNLEIGDLKKSFQYDITFNKVIDEEVKKPNIEEYNKVESQTQNDTN